MRKLFLLFWALLATTCLWAHDFVVDGIYYNFLDGNNVAVTYKGSSYDAYNNEYSGEVTIPETVTYNGTTYNVTSIGNYAFELCTSLTSITIPNSVTSIGKYAFDDCTSLASITIPNSVTSIGDNAFEDCSSFTSVTIPNSVTSIGEGTFFICTSLTSITIPNSVTTIGGQAFYRCSSLTSITIPNSVTTIGNYAFQNCSSLDTIYVEATTPPTIESNTFTNTPTSICYIPCGTKSVYEASAWAQYMGEFVEEGCIDSTIIITYTSTDGNIVTPYNAEAFGANIISNTYENGVGTITFDAPITIIGYEAFADCSSLTSLIIPNSVTSIGDAAFYNCSSLTSITIPYSVKFIATGAFSECSSLTSITIPNSITRIGEGVFVGCSSLTSITIPNSVTSIGDYAFSECSSLTSITIPNSVTSIGEWVFSYCSSLTSVTVEEGNTAYDSRKNCNAIIETATNALIVGCQNTIIPNSVTSIGDCAFIGCDSLTSITIPNSVTSIGDYAFSECSSLTSITIPNSVTSIEENAFSSCRSLTSITIPNSVTSIGGETFSGCSSLKTVICEAVEVPEIGGRVFRSMPLSEATLYVPAQSLDDYKAADQWKEFGTILPLEDAPASVENIPSTMTNSQKIIRDGKLVIIRDGVEYNVMGQQL